MGSRPAKSPTKSNAAGSSAGVEVGHGHRPDARLHVGHPPRREALADEGAHPGVPGGVHRQERHGSVCVGTVGRGVEGDPVGVRVVVEVAEGGEHVGVAREREEVELLVVEDGASARSRA